MEWSPTRRHLMQGTVRPSSSITVIHSQVARPSGPEKLQVISNKPLALLIGFTLSEAGQLNDPVSATRSAALLKSNAAFRKSVFSREVSL